MNRLIILSLFSIFTGLAALGNDILIFSERVEGNSNPKENRDETPSSPKVTQDGHSITVETDREENIRVEITTREGEVVRTCQETAATTIQIEDLDEGDYTIEIEIEEDLYAGDFSI